MIKEVDLTVGDERWEDITLLSISDKRLLQELFNRGLTPDDYAKLYRKLYAETENQTARLAYGQL